MDSIDYYRFFVEANQWRDWTALDNWLTFPMMFEDFFATLRLRLSDQLISALDLPLIWIESFQDTVIFPAISLQGNTKFKWNTIGVFSIVNHPNRIQFDDLGNVSLNTLGPAIVQG
jgi:hypothetical protein